MTTPNADHRPPVHPALAVSLASSHLGFHVHAGFMAGLRAQGIGPGHIGGASSGAFVGGLSAAGFSPDQIRGILTSSEMRSAFWEWRSPLRGVAMLANRIGYTGLLSGRKMLRMMQNIVGSRRIEECRHAELSLAVTNLTRGVSQVVRQGPLAEFIVASCSVPGLFQNFEIDGERYWDGAVSDSSPFHHFLTDPRIGAVLAHVVSHADGERGPRPTVAWAFGRAHQIVTDRFLALTLECGTLRGHRVLVLKSEVPPYRFGQKETFDELFEIGFQTAAHHAAAIRQLADSLPTQGPQVPSGSM